MKHRLVMLFAALLAATAVSLAVKPNQNPAPPAEKSAPAEKPSGKRSGAATEKRKSSPARPAEKPKETPAAPAKSASTLPDLDMVWVDGGTFRMGSEDSDAWDSEKPVHTVSVSGFSIGKYEVTQRLWKAVMGENDNPSYSKGDNLPVENVSWDDVQEFIRKLNRMTGKKYRLPTEAEWEYAARGGNRSRGYKYSGSNDIDAVAWYNGNSGDTTHPVGTKASNELGIYDMTGNVWEWCQDWYGGDYYSVSPSNNPKGTTTGSRRVNRGGGWFNNSWDCSVSDRDRCTPDDRYGGLGFRLAL